MLFRRSSLRQPRVASTPKIKETRKALILTSWEKRLLKNAPYNPPVTPYLLGELDLSSISNNPDVRVEINFDPGVTLAPTFGRGEGRCRQSETASYWDSLSIEMAQYAVLSACQGDANIQLSTTNFDIGSFKPRLPTLLNTLRNIIMALTSGHRQECVKEVLDVPLILQELRNGALNIRSLAASVGCILKHESSLLSIEKVRCMINQLEHKFVSQHPEDIIDGVKTVLDLLEGIKLVQNFNVGLGAWY